MNARMMIEDVYIRRITGQENPPTPRKKVKRVYMAAATVNTAIHKHFWLKCSHKALIHDLQLRNIKERNTNCSKLNELHLVRDKWKIVVTLHEAYISLSDSSNILAITYRNINANGCKDFVHQ